MLSVRRPGVGWTPSPNLGVGHLLGGMAIDTETEDSIPLAEVAVVAWRARFGMEMTIEIARDPA